VEKIRRALPVLTRRRRHMPALAWRDVPAFVEALRSCNRKFTDSENPGTREDSLTTWPTVPLALEWLVLTAARTNEVLGARWDELEGFQVSNIGNMNAVLDNSKTAEAVWTIPGSRTKSGRPHRVPLAPEAIAVLDKAALHRDQSPYLFPGRRYTRPLSNMTLLKATRRLKYAVTVHGFRSSFRDWAAERTTFAREVCEAALAHVVEDKVEAAYRRTDFFELRTQLMATWAKFVTTPAGSVVQIRA
jgi:integrase